ncbi:helix-turn-helix domain-containing protein [Corynebacterium simulans]
MENNDGNQFGNNLVRIREGLEINRTELQRRIAERGHDMHMTTLRRIESGEQEPKVSDAIRIAEALGVSVELLLSSSNEYPALNDVELSRAQFHSAVREACIALSEWENRGRELFKKLQAARDAGVPEKLLFDAAGELGRSDDIDGLIDTWETSSTGFHAWRAILAEETGRE